MQAVFLKTFELHLGQQNQRELGEESSVEYKGNLYIHTSIHLPVSLLRFLGGLSEDGRTNGWLNGRTDSPFILQDFIISVPSEATTLPT